MVPAHQTLAASLAALFIAMGGVCLVVQHQRLAARFIAAGVTAAIVGSLISIIATNETNPATAELLSGFVALAGGISVVVGAWVTAVVIFSAAVLAALALPALESWTSFLARVVADHWITALIVLAAPLIAIVVLFRSMHRLRNHLLATGRGRTFQRWLVGLLDWATGGRRRLKRTNRHIGELGATRRARHGRGPTRI